VRLPARFQTPWLLALSFLVGSVTLSGCAVRGGSADGHPGIAAVASSDALTAVDATAEPPEDGATELQGPDYDPWERFNERMFAFNLGLDRRIVKPAATGWSKAVPEPLRKGLQNALRNLAMPRRFVNNLVQLKVDGAVRELAGFALNSTVGIAGLGDVARAEGVAPPDEEDTGQTLAVYGVKPGPYLVLPLFPPSTVRDTIGSTVDGFLDPLGLVMPLVGSIAKRVGGTVNDRSMNLELFKEVEDSVLDLYSGTRNLYLQRRERAIRE
jgi:phospholipid-binding lipoprotein MlaA